MEPLILQETKYLPKITLDKDYGIFEITGRSLPKNPDEFYFPIFNWIDKYIENPNEYTTLVLNVDYMNTASHKCLAIILNKLDALVKKEDSNIKVIWNYDSDDEDMLEMGEELEDCNDIPFEFVAYKA